MLNPMGCLGQQGQMSLITELEALLCHPCFQESIPCSPNDLGGHSHPAIVRQSRPMLHDGAIPVHHGAIGAWLTPGWPVASQILVAKGTWPATGPQHLCYAFPVASPGQRFG